jgi:hypothetical protein
VEIAARMATTLGEDFGGFFSPGSRTVAYDPALHLDSRQRGELGTIDLSRSYRRQPGNPAKARRAGGNAKREAVQKEALQKHFSPDPPAKMRDLFQSDQLVHGSRREVVGSSTQNGKVTNLKRPNGLLISEAIP